jgi:hypothetical protein
MDRPIANMGDIRHANKISVSLKRPDHSEDLSIWEKILLKWSSVK